MAFGSLYARHEWDEDAQAYRVWYHDGRTKLMDGRASRLITPTPRKPSMREDIAALRAAAEGKGAPVPLLSDAADAKLARAKRQVANHNRARARCGQKPSRRDALDHLHRDENTGAAILFAVAAFVAAQWLGATGNAKPFKEVNAVTIPAQRR